MTPQQWRLVRQLFDSAVQRPVEERSGFLALACAGDEALHAVLVKLVSGHVRAGGFLEGPLVVSGDIGLAEAFEEAVFEGTDRFVVTRTLGSGAFGTVYEVTDHKRGAQVALKTLRFFG